MIKNDANKCVKPVEVAKPTIAHHKPAADIENHKVHAISQDKTHVSSDIRPMSKIDIIKKFDGSNKTSDQTDNDALVRRAKRTETPKYTDNDPDAECENNENIENASYEDNAKGQPNENDAFANNNNKYDNGNTEVATPPKPLPRTSRNNSVSSLSSEYGIGAPANNANDEIARPVAKPRTTTTNYKVHFYITTSLSHTHTLPLFCVIYTFTTLINWNSPK